MGTTTKRKTCLKAQRTTNLGAIGKRGRLEMLEGAAAEEGVKKKFGIWAGFRQRWLASLRILRSL